VREKDDRRKERKPLRVTVCSLFFQSDGRLRAGRLRAERLRVHQQDVLPPDEQLVDVAFEDPAVRPGLFLPAGLRFDSGGAGASGLRPPAGGPVFRGSVWVLRGLVSRRVLLQLQLLEELNTGFQSR